MRSSLYTFWFLAAASDAVGAVLACAYLFRLRTRLGWFLGLCLASVAVEATMATASLLLFWPNEYEVAPAFAVMRAAGRSVKCLGVWTLVLYFLNFCDGLHKTISAPSKQ